MRMDNVKQETASASGSVTTTSDLGDGSESITTKYTYDDRGNKISEVYANGAKKTYEYNRSSYRGRHWMSAYMGRWYEIARYENHFEKGMTDVTATYTLRSDGRIRVENEGFKDGIHKKAVGRAKQPEPENSPGKLKVAFFLLVLFRLLYLRTRRHYQYVVVGSSSDKYLCDFES